MATKKTKKTKECSEDYITSHIITKEIDEIWHPSWDMLSNYFQTETKDDMQKAVNIIDETLIKVLDTITLPQIVRSIIYEYHTKSIDAILKNPCLKSTMNMAIEYFRLFLNEISAINGNTQEVCKICVIPHCTTKHTQKL